MNSFNVCRLIAEMRIGNSIGSDEKCIFNQKLLKLTILTEQWPYRMGWLLQFLEDMQQQHCMHEALEERAADAKGSGDNAAARGIKQSNRLELVLLKLAQKVNGSSKPLDLAEKVIDDKSKQAEWSDAIHLPALCVYQQIVHGLIYAPSEHRQLLALDGDPQNFEQLLMAEPTFLVADLLAFSKRFRLDDDEELPPPEQMLCNYNFCMNPGILLKIAQFLDQLALGRTSSMTESRYVKKEDLFDKKQHLESRPQLESRPMSAR